MNLELIKPIFKSVITICISATILILAISINQNTPVNNSYTVEDEIDDLLVLSLQLHLQQLNYRNDCNEQIIEQLDEYGKADFPCFMPPKYEHNEQELQKIQWKIEVLQGQLKDETK